MKIKLIALFVTLVSLAFGQNQLYVNQITTSGNTTFVQVGSLNKVGSSQTPSNITGDNILFEMRQMGNNNTTDFSIIDANNLKLVSVFNGNTNTQKIFMSGANDNMNLLFNGTIIHSCLIKMLLLTIHPTQIQQKLLLAIAISNSM